MAIGFASYEIARSGLFVSERNLNVTGHNIANLNTTGYVRQQAILKDAGYQTLLSANGVQQIGMGAGIQEIRQIRHSFLDNIYRQENTTLGYWETRSKAFSDVQAIMGEPMGNGLQDVLNQFWDSWQELSKEPDSLTVRALVRQRGEALADHINHLGTQLDKQQNDLNSELQVRIDEVNQISSQIAGLNVEIMKNEVSGDNANDYRDQRNSLIDRLTKLANVDVSEMQDGQVDITLGGYYLVQKSTSTELVAEEKNAGDIFYVPKIKGTNIQVPVSSGIIQGLLEARGEVSGEIGGIENGSPATKTDVTFVIDNSASGSFSAAEFDNIKQNILNYASEIKKNGLDFNFKIVTTVSDTVSTPLSFSSSQYSDFVNAVNGLTQTAGTQTADFSNVFNTISGMTYRPDENKYAVVFTNDNAAGETAAYNSILGSAGIKTSVVTGTGAANSWDQVTSATGGTLYTTIAGASALGSDINANVNENISVVSNTKNIIPDIKKGLNALVNILTREVNYLHQSGKTLGSNSTNGEAFFVPINPGRPLELGNIRINPNLSNLSNIAVSSDGTSGDNTIALKIANLRNQDIIKDSTGYLSPDGYYQGIILAMGNEGSEADGITDSQTKLVQSADSSRTSITGVSMDEEMSNMMKFKYAYDASARALNVIDNMMETIITQMGHVGR